MARSTSVDDQYDPNQDEQQQDPSGFPDQSHLQVMPGGGTGQEIGIQTPDQQQSTAAPGTGGEISSWQGYTPGGVEDMWGQFLTSSGYGQQGQTDPYGFGGWGNAAGGTDINKVVSDFNAKTGLNARAVGNDKIDFGAQGGGVRDVIRNVGANGGGQWWMAGPEGQGGGGGGGVPAGPAG